MPSPSDLAEATYDDFVYVIVGLGSDPPDLRAWRLEGGRFVEAAVEVQSPPLSPGRT